MSFFEILHIAIKSLVKNKARTILTMLGIIIGVGAVITMMGIGSGAQQTVNDQIEEMGTNVVSITSNFTKSIASSGSGTGTFIEVEDVDYILDEVDNINYISPVVNNFTRLKSKYGNWRTVFYGVNEQYLYIRNYDISEGEFFSATDIKKGSKVCVLGKTVSDNLFPDGDALGNRVIIRKVPCTVIGVMAPKGETATGEDQDNRILLPYTTALSRIQSHRKPIISINISTVSKDDIEQVKSDAMKIMLMRHRTATEENFTIKSQADMADMANTVSSTMTILLSCIAGISLIVGGIGIMNIMLVSVTERIKEIGLRMAIGAKKKDVLNQFLIESFFLSGTGGILGIILGIVLAYILGDIMNWKVSITPFSVLLSFGFSTIIGIFFGWYPAKKAANLNLIDALRYE